MERRTIILHAVFGVNGAEGFVAEFFFGCLLNIPQTLKSQKIQTTPSIKEVSRCWINVRMNAISLRALSNMTLGSEALQRRQLGAITMAKLLASILVTEDTSVCEKICSPEEEKKKLQKKN